MTLHGPSDFTPGLATMVSCLDYSFDCDKVIGTAYDRCNCGSSILPAWCDLTAQMCNLMK